MGVFPADQIPRKWHKPSAFVLNTDPSFKPGSHWVALYVEKNGSGWYLDSYGFPCMIEEHLKSIKNNCRNFRYNTVQLQSDNSSVCGHFCILFLHFMSCGYSMDDFVRIFSSNLSQNDRIVRNYVSSLKRKTSNTIGQIEYVRYLGRGGTYKCQGCCARFKLR